MKNTTLVLAAILIGACVVSRPAAAQDKTPAATKSKRGEAVTPEDRMENRLKLAKNHLGITDAQVEQLRTVLANNQDKLQADRKRFLAADTGSKELKAARKQLVKDRAVMMRQLEPVLTEEQVEKFKKTKLYHIEDGDERVGTKKKAVAKTK